MIDRDLAELYGVSTMALNQAVKRNHIRFPPDFMFQLTKNEYNNLISQFVISSSPHGGRRHFPFAFTEQGVAMLSSVLRSKRAIMVNIQIVRMFIKLRDMISDYDALRLKLEALERNYDEQFRIVFDAIRKTIAYEEQPKNEIGFS